MKHKLLRWIGPVFALLLFSVALWVLHHELKAYQYRDVVASIRTLPPLQILLAFTLTIAGYAVLTAYDVLSLRYVRKPLAYRKIALASFIGYAFSHNIGFALFSGAPVRYRFFSAWGLSALDVGKIVAFNAFTFWLGFLALGGLLFIFLPFAPPPELHLPPTSLRPVGIAFFALLGAYVLGSTLHKRPFVVRGWSLTLPAPRLVAAQIGVSSLDWTLAGSVLYLLMPADTGLSYPALLGIFLLAQIAGLMSQLPGGLGVFETVILLCLPPSVPHAAVFGSLLAYRGLYYLFPFVVAVAIFGGYEVLARRERFAHIAATLGQWSEAVIPPVMTCAVFIGGTLLLFSGATPAVPGRLTWLKEFVPLPFVELSHFLGSLVGVGLLILARGLQLRLHVAYVLTTLLVGSGVVFSLLKGIDYEEAFLLLILLVALLPCRSYFFREASLIQERLSPDWLVAISLVSVTTVWLGLFSYKHLDYSSELWWQFAFDANAPRTLRASVGIMAGLFSFALLRLLQPAQPKPVLPGPEDVVAAQAIISRASDTTANLALLGDKSLLFSQSKQAFLMYAIEGKSWIALGDPIGDGADQRELVWRFRELSEQYGGRPVFYAVRADTLPLYVDLGLSLLKLGEEGRVRLEDFSLQGHSRKEFRRTIRKIEAAGGMFEVLPAEQVTFFLPELKAISNAWLTDKNTQEKGFSLGFFTPEYIRQFPAGVVRQHGRIIAFANLWLGAEKKELSLDLMRYVPDAPSGVMEFLFIQLMLWGKQQGYHWFSLGMAPLSGLQDHELAPLWNRLGAFVFRHGEHFYNFQGLRQYKDKFDPEWEPRYLACPGGLALPSVLTNLATLISGGLGGVVTK